MADPASDDAPGRDIHDALTRAGAPAPQAALTPPPQAPPARIAHYTLVRKLGQGGMGVVYAARDERLQREVALKMMSALARDETARQRFWREARAAASVNHPHVCQIHDVGEENGEPYIVMELLTGEPLSQRLFRGPLSVADTVSFGHQMLAALGALHGRGIVHRDLKPSNVFLTGHGVKLLDFGLARPAAEGAGDAAFPDLTRTGMMVGTPRYMAPEQVTGDVVDARCDLFAAGAILFEMLAGRPAFEGRNAVEVLHATLHEQPPALTGAPAVTALDRLIRRALAKSRDQRPASAEAMDGELRELPAALPGDTPAVARALTRLVVLPFRVLRADPETDFLSFSLADAIATSLKESGPLVVRSSAVAARFAGEGPDLAAVAARADVDRVVLGTLLRAGDQVRATAQLVEAPAGTLLASLTVQSSLGDLFGLQDDIARRVVEALALPLRGEGATPTPAAPHDARAYELYLRANELARTYEGLQRARDLYQRALELDPGFAPAWAQLGRAHRVIGKYIEGTPDSEARAEEALRRALELSPRLSVAQKYYAQLEADMGRAQQAMVRLLHEAARHGNDPELFAGLVHACRYCGLFEESVAAHHEARRLDPNVPTGLEQTLLMAGDVDWLLSGDRLRVGGGGDDVIRVIALGLVGRREEALQRLLAMRGGGNIKAFQDWVRYLRSWLERRRDDMVSDILTFSGLRIMEDPEAMFQEGWLLCDVGEHERGLLQLRRAVDKGYFVSATLAGSPAFAGVRGDARFQDLLARAEAGRQQARAAFGQAGGDRLLGLTSRA